ncbi:SRPBCC family protein [Microlunatus speluncae]|uniref:SRPBCC family protein n=1 Tax=Microlunatus speluncae TaxID=2594267 RepID=UPI0013756D7C|nr:SRPBCC family protein [Microlunatus speluncae]
MQLSHRFTVPARVEDVWAAFNQLKRVAPHFPGATLDSVRGDDFTGSIKIKFGPSLLLYNGSGRVVERNQPDRQLIIEARGRDRRGQGSATAVLTGRFTGLDGGGTEILTETDLTLTGRPAQFGQALISEAVDRILDRFVHGVADQLNARGPVSATTETGPDLSGAPESPSEAVPPEVAEPVEDDEPAADSAEPEEQEEGPAVDPRGDDADFATVPLTPAAATGAGPDEAVVPEPAADPEDDATEEPATDLPIPTTPPEPAPEPRPGPRPGVVEPIREPSGLRRYAPAAAAAVAGVTAVVVWAIGRRRR